MSVLNSQELLLQEDWSDCNVHKMDVALTHLYMNTMIRFIYSILCTKPLQLLFGDPDLIGHNAGGSSPTGWLSDLQGMVGAFLSTL